MREAHCFSTCDANQLPTERLVEGCWTQSSFGDLLVSHLRDQSRPTVLFLHGNRTNADWSESRGLQAYENLFQGCLERPAIRMVIVQWKSEPECKRVLQDYMVKSRRAVALGESFNCVLNQFEGRKPILIGYSLGAQVILSALNSTERPNQDPVVDTQTTNGFRVAILAAAFDCDFVRCRGCNYSFNDRVMQTLIFNNDTDLVVNASERICSKQLGTKFDTRCFLTSNCLNPGQTSVFDVACQVGKKHSVVRYTQSNTVIQQINGLIIQ